MKLKKSQFKEAVKAITRECLNERCGGGHLAGGDKGKRMFGHVEKSEKEQGKPTKVAKQIAGATVNKRLGNEQVGADVVAGEGQESPCAYSKEDEVKLIKVLDHIADILLSFNDEMGAPEPTEEPSPEMNAEPSDEPVEEPTEEPSAPEEEGEVDENVSSYNTGPSNRGAQYKVVAPHRYTDVEEDPARNQQVNPEINEAGLTSETGIDTNEKTKLLRVVKHIADKLLGMSSGEMPDIEEPSPEPSFEEPMDEPSEPSFGGDSNDEPVDEPADKEPPKKKEKEEDPTEFTKKLAKENHKVQKRSYRTSNDTSYDPKNVRDPNIPGT